jgi:hypothetical protein
MNRKQMEEGFYLIDPTAKEMLTISTVAKTLTAATYGTNTRARVQCQGADIRYWMTGDTPDTDTGFLLYDKGTLELRTTAEVANFKAIRDAGTDAVLAVQYYK